MNASLRGHVDDDDDEAAAVAAAVAVAAAAVAVVAAATGAEALRELGQKCDAAGLMDPPQVP